MNYEKLLCCISYIPILGWTITIYGQEEDSLAYNHGKQALAMLFLNSLIFIFYWLCKSLIPVEFDDYIYYGFYIIIGFYLISLLIAIIMVFIEKDYNIPLYRSLANRIPF